jgi:hypothetical protein
MKLLNIETPVTRNFIPQILLNVQTFTSIRLATQVMTNAAGLSHIRQGSLDNESTHYTKTPKNDCSH